MSASTSNDNFLGMNSFGASAPYKELYDHFGINSENLIKMIKNNIKAKVI